MKKLLIVEDNSGDYYLIREAIRAAGIDCEIIRCQDGLSAIQMIESESLGALDLVVLDLNLPKRNGIEVLQVIRDLPRVAALPAVVLTSSDSSAEHNHADKLGIQHYFVKPLLFEEYLQIGLCLRDLLGLTPTVADSSPSIAAG